MFKNSKNHRSKMKGSLGFIPLIAILAVVSLIAAQSWLFSFVGFAPLSLSSVSYNGGSNEWLMTVVANGQGNSFQGNFDHKDIQSNGKISKADFSVTVSIDQNFATYDIRNDYDPIYRFETANIGFYAFSNDADRTCANNANGREYAGVAKPQGTLNSYCIYKTRDAYKGTLSQGSQFFNALIMVTRYGALPTEDKKININNIATTAQALPEGIGQVSWIGSLVTGQALPQPSDQDIIALWNNQKTWITASRSSFDTWRAKANNYQNCVVGNEPTFLSCIADINSWESQVLQGKQFTIAGGGTATTAGIVDSGQLKITLPNLYTLPILTFRIRADWLGITVPNGIPQIVSAQMLSKLKTGEVGVAEVVVKNVGDGMGAFDVSSSCDQGASAQSVPVRINVDVGQVGSAFIKTTGSATQMTTVVCTVTVLDVNSLQKVTSSYMVTVDPLAVCQDGIKRTTGNLVQECKNGGWVTTKECPTDSPPDPFTFECISKTNSSAKDCGPLGLTCLFGQLNILLLLILVLIGAWMLSKFIK